jgi:alpha-L-fucosidase
VYVHILDWTGPSLSLPSLGRKVKSAKMLDGGAAVEFREDEYGLELKLPKNSDEVDRIVLLQLDAIK